MKASFLHGWMDVAADYEASGGNTEVFDREDFIAWILTRSQDAQARAKGLPTTGVNGLISMYLSFMARYAAYYSRRVFRHTDIYSLDDWGVLVSLFPAQTMSKTRVIRACLMEKSSGNEVIKRLLKQGFIAEMEHPEDQRSKLIHLTPAGHAAFMSVRERMDRLSNLVAADLSESEKTQFLEILQKLHRFHWPIFEAADEADLARRLTEVSE